MYLGSRNTFVAQESGARLQENGRFAMDTIANDLRMSGFRGCMPVLPTGNSAAPLALGAVDNTLNTPADLRYNFGEPIWGSRNGGGGWAPALSAPVNGLGVDAAGDILLLRRPAGVAWALVAEMANRTAALTITPTANFQRGDLLMVADCAGASMLQATNVGPGAAGTVQHVPGAGGVVPGVSTGDVATGSITNANTVRASHAMTLAQPGSGYARTLMHSLAVVLEGDGRALILTKAPFLLSDDGTGGPAGGGGI
jgi:type IV pilus assembly protein PilW